MNLSSKIAVAGILVVSTVFGVAAQESAMESLTLLGTALQSSRAWQADYSQEYIAAGMDFGEEESGRVTAAWPDRALFRTGQPVRQLMGLNGRLVRLVDLEVRSCDQHHLSDDEWARIPLAAILDPGVAIEHFSVLEHGEHGFALVPREQGGVQRVEVTLGSNDLPIEVVVIDPQGAINRLRFATWQPADPPTDDQWLPEAPKDVECVTDNE